MSYNQFYSSVNQPEETLPLMKNFSIISLFLMMFTLATGLILQYTLFNPFVTGNLDMRGIWINIFIVNAISLVIFVISLILAIKGKSRNHTPVLAIIMIVVSSLAIFYGLFTVAGFLWMAEFILAS